MILPPEFWAQYGLPGAFILLLIGAVMGLWKSLQSSYNRYETLHQQYLVAIDDYTEALRELNRGLEKVIERLDFVDAVKELLKGRGG